MTSQWVSIVCHQTRRKRPLSDRERERGTVNKPPFVLLGPRSPKWQHELLFVMHIHSLSPVNAFHNFPVPNNNTKNEKIQWQGRPYIVLIVIGIWPMLPVWLHEPLSAPTRSFWLIPVPDTTTDSVQSKQKKEETHHPRVHLDLCFNRLKEMPFLWQGLVVGIKHWMHL